jgi:hypothetical protein
MPTECSPTLFEFAPVEGRRVVASFEGGAITSGAGALLLGQADCAIGLTERFAARFTDRRTPELVECQVETLVMQRVFGIALGYEGRFFHRYYDCYCYLPPYIFCGRHLLAAKLRGANADAAAGAVEEVARVVATIRRRWSRPCILLRGDSGFCREALMAWCEANRVDYVFGLAGNEGLDNARVSELITATIESIRTGKPARCFKDLAYRTLNSWSRERRVIGEAELTGGESNPRFIVTSLARSEARARHLYKKVYCVRGDMENRIAECQLDLFADRTSTATIPANQLRLWFASMAYVLLCALRRIGSRVHAIHRGHLRHHPAGAAEAGRPGHSQRPADQDCHGLGLSVAVRVRARAGVAAQRCRLTRTRQRADGHPPQTTLLWQR